MLEIKNEGVILEKTDLDFENEAVLNPACIEVDGVTHMFYRAVSTGNFSTIGYCQLKDNNVIQRHSSPILVPGHEYEKHGLEDPKIVFLDGFYYLFYTAYDGRNARVAYATSTDLVHFEKKGPITPAITYDEAEDLFPQVGLKEKYRLFESHLMKEVGKRVLLWEKDAFIFPKKFNGKFALIHRILPGMQVIYFDNFSQLNEEYWKNYLKDLNKYIMLDPKYWFESRNIGGGCPPIETEEGWLLIYHAIEDTDDGKIYRACAALLDLKDPTKEIGRLEEPLFSPEEPWEKRNLKEPCNDLVGVVFPSGSVIRNGRIYIYYGADDRLIACRSVNLKELLIELKKARP
ncbi:MAG: pesticidal protein Cry7Aa [Patescibacteria group bacterium]|nr:pesticidal protein Cry7Aa [Patescibacteria group bacterium]